MKGASTVEHPAGNDNTEGKFNILVGPGATVDATFRWTNEETYSDTDGHRLPAAWPQSLNLQEGDFWSGSPYLGDSGQLNPGILTKTQCGEYYHVAHNHDLTQVTNYGITFGGMLTLIKVEPPAAAQAATEPGLRLMEKHTMNDTTANTQPRPATRREGTLMGTKKNTKRLVAAAIAIAGLAGGAAVVHAATFGRRGAGTRCASSVSCRSPRPARPAALSTSQLAWARSTSTTR